MASQGSGFTSGVYSTYFGGIKKLISEYFSHLVTPEDLPDQHDKVAIITGANKGIGFETARVLCKLGAYVILACRSSVNANLAVEKLKKEVPNAKVEFMKLNLSSLTSVKEFVAAFKEKELPLHILINNAAVMITPYEKTEDGFELQFATNYLGHFALTLQLLDVLNDSGFPDQYTRVVNISSDVHRHANIDFDILNSSSAYCPYRAYQQSKLANILFTYGLQRRLLAEGCHVTVNALHPGIGNTDLFQNVPSLLLTTQKYILPWLFKTAEQSAYSSLYVAVSPKLEGLGGRYYDNCQEVQSSEESYNEDIQRQLWDVSCTLMKFFNWPKFQQNSILHHLPSLLDYKGQIIVSRGDGLEAPLSFKMTQGHVIVLKKAFVIGWRKEILWTRDGEGLTTRDDEGLH